VDPLRVDNAHMKQKPKRRQHDESLTPTKDGGKCFRKVNMLRREVSVSKFA